jgi:hypothetical protein
VLACGVEVVCSFVEQATKRLRLAKVARESVIFLNDIIAPFFWWLKVAKAAETFHLNYIK